MVTQHHLPRTTWVPGDAESNGGDPGRTAFSTHCSALRATVYAPDDEVPLQHGSAATPPAVISDQPVKAAARLQCVPTPARPFVAKVSDAPRDHGWSAYTRTPLAWGATRCLSRIATVRRKDHVCFAALSNPRQGWGACTPKRGSWRAHILDLSVSASPHLSAAVTFSGSTVRLMRSLRGGEG